MHSSPSINFFRAAKGQRIQKIPVDIGASCPNRDGTLSNRGCLFCSPNSFVPYYCSPEKTVKQQLDEGIAFFAKKYHCQGFLAYFQSHSATHVEKNKFFAACDQALEHPQIKGIVVATRPDCLDDVLLKRMSAYAQKTTIRFEIGIESLDAKVLQAMNRCHSSEQALDAINRSAASGIEVCGHVILGLPGETETGLIRGARLLSKLSSLKLHHLQIVKGSQLANDFVAGNSMVKTLSPEEYVELAALFLANLSENVRIERLINRVPRPMLLAPIWNGIAESEMRILLEKHMAKAGLRQGCRQFANFSAAS